MVEYTPIHQYKGDGDLLLPDEFDEIPLAESPPTEPPIKPKDCWGTVVSWISKLRFRSKTPVCMSPYEEDGDDDEKEMILLH